MPVENQHEKQWLYCYPNTDNKREENGSQLSRGQPAASRCLDIGIGYKVISREGRFAREQFVCSMCICRFLSQK